jgi:hypothetical protein
VTDSRFYHRGALRVLPQRSYISVEQAALIRAEDELLEKDIAPLRVALRDGTLTTCLRATVERLGRVDF